MGSFPLCIYCCQLHFLAGTEILYGMVWYGMVSHRMFQNKHLPVPTVQEVQGRDGDHSSRGHRDQQHSHRWTCSKGTTRLNMTLMDNYRHL